MKTTYIKVLLAVLCLVMVPGCGDKGSFFRASRKADTPAQALENMQLAIQAGDKEAFVDCFEVNDKQKKVLAAFSGSAIALGEFSRAMAKAYGEEAAIEAMRGVNQNTKFSAENWREELEIKIDGDTATAVRKGERRGISLLRKDGVWKIDARSMLGADEDISEKDSEMMIKVIKATAIATKQTTEKIGQSGYTAKMIVKELEKAIMQASWKTAMEAAGPEGLSLPKP